MTWQSWSGEDFHLYLQNISMTFKNTSTGDDVDYFGVIVARASQLGEGEGQDMMDTK